MSIRSEVVAWIGGAIWLVFWIVVLVVRRQAHKYSWAQSPRREDLAYVGASEQVATLLAHDLKIQAIIAYRQEAGGMGLREAKDEMDALIIRARVLALTRAGASARVADLLAREHALRAMQVYRSERGASLRTAKAAIEALRAAQIPPQSRR